jgi:hypothetical protein
VVSEQPPFAGGEATAAETSPRPSERRVLGVAFPHTDICASRSDELERRFLQLAYAVCRLRSGRRDAVGYFAVLSQQVRDAVLRLRSQYQVEDAVSIVFTSLLVSDMTTLATAAERAAAEGDESILVSVAQQIAADTLLREISLREPGVVGDATQDDAPFGVQWDYQGKKMGPGG